MKKILGLFVATMAMFAMWSCGDDNVPEDGPILRLISASIGQDEEVEDGPGIALRMARAMGWGWNLGNHFDTGANSDAAGNPIDFQRPKWGYWDGATPTRQLYQNLASIGVGTVRIPVTWGVYQANDADYTIDADEKYREYYLEYFTRCASLKGIPMMLWDNNTLSGEAFQFISHDDGTFPSELNESLVRMMIHAATSTDPAYTLKSVYDKTR